MEGFSYLAHELSWWPVFLRGLLYYLLVAILVAGQAVMSVYAAWYIASFMEYLVWRRQRPRLEPMWEGPLVAVVVPVYNDYEVRSSLEALVKQKYRPYLVVIVDDSSDFGLVADLSNHALRSGGKVIHLRRHGRRGLKAGALNDAIDLLEKYRPKYVVFFDADFEPPPDTLARLVAYAERFDADIVQGYQRHVKGSETLFGLVYRASQGGAIVNMIGRMMMSMMPIFTGSCALIRYDLLYETRFREGSISEDWRWTIDVLLERERLRYIAVDEVYANGSVPKSQRAFIRQQLRWSSGTLYETLCTLLDFMSARLPLGVKVGYLLQGLFYSQGLWVYLTVLSSLLLAQLYGVDLQSYVWPLGLYVWLLGIETAILAGALIERYTPRQILSTAVATLAMIYYVAATHAYGTLIALLGETASWRVTGKRGSYEAEYQD
ncbi:hypothetical protein PABY_14960 [Pyrodictium abyssi]|uniref:Glycosyltransferase 2-like domain-containing protein n=1 Tax=Pyrodictium abyssi TaxID=54256 RepID=A0ABM8IWK1_9CREN|nr:hypothetical protein PABY_14960 [Pyrodictium abyssi]